VIAYLDTKPTPDADLAELLPKLARPTIGHWWALVRALTVRLADADADFVAIKDLLIGRARDDLPRVAGLDAALMLTLEGKAGSRSTVRLTELFDCLVRYRNREIGHGASGQRPPAHYDELGRALLLGVPALLERLDVLAGRRLVYLADVRRLGSGAWLVERYELTGETSRRLESLEPTHAEAAELLPQRVYLGRPGPPLRSMHPLVAYDFEANEFLFLNARRGKQRVEHLCYTSGRPSDSVESSAQNALLAELLGVPVDDARREEWQARSHAEESPGEEEKAPPSQHSLGEFELLSELGRGGMGVVYRAWQPSLGRQVALKCLLRVGDPKAEARFSREIAALGHVEHPHLVRIFTSGVDGDRWFYAMELVEGTTLAAVCELLQERGSSAGDADLPTWQQAVSTACEEARRAEKPISDTAPTDAPSVPASGPTTAARGPLPGRSYVRHVAELVRQVAEAAHALHEKNIIHRDVKPGNVMLSPDGATATLMDLGLAQIADDVQGRLTKTRQFVGTLRYASPEQVLAVARLDRRSDVYSLGATLWELLTLRPLFGATDATPTPELMQKIQIEEPGRVRRLNPAVPRDLAAVVEKYLQKDAKKRYATARELAEELESFLAGKPVKARPVGVAGRTWRWCKRHPIPTSFLILGMAIGIAVPRISSTGTPAPAITPTPVQVTVEEWKEAEELLVTAGLQNPLVFKYRGGDVEFWIELERGGFTDRYPHNPMHLPPLPEGIVDSGGIIEGYFIFTRGSPNEEGREVWSVARRRARVAKQSSGTVVSMLQTQAWESQSQEKSASGSFLFRSDYPVWGIRPFDVRVYLAVQEILWFSNQNPVNQMAFPPAYGQIWSAANYLCPGIEEMALGDISNPLPTDTPVRLKEIQRKRKQGKILLEQQVVRIMCKVVSENDKASEHEAHAK
jgi:serine/threonine protein kinase